MKNSVKILLVINVALVCGLLGMQYSHKIRIANKEKQLTQKAVTDMEALGVMQSDDAGLLWKLVSKAESGTNASQAEIDFLFGLLDKDSPEPYGKGAKSVYALNALAVFAQNDVFASEAIRSRLMKRISGKDLRTLPETEVIVTLKILSLNRQQTELKTLDLSKDSRPMVRDTYKNLVRS